MKNSLRLFAIVLFAFCQSCSTNYEEINSESLDEESLQTVNEFYNLSAPAKRLSYNLLTNKERFYVWSQAFKDLLSDKNLSSDQRTHLIDISSRLNENFFSDKESQERKTFIENYMPNWNKRAIELFGQEKYSYIKGYPIYVQSKSARLGNTLVGFTSKETPASCDCHGGNTDCNNTNGTHQCKKESCDGSTYGCGDWWMQTCDYVCYYGKKRAQDEE